MSSAKQNRIVYTRVALAAFLIAPLFRPTHLHAQGCAMCYQSAAASGARLIRALKSGIVIMMIPPVLMTCAFARLVYRKRNVCNQD